MLGGAVLHSFHEVCIVVIVVAEVVEVVLKLVVAVSKKVLLALTQLMLHLELVGDKTWSQCSGLRRKSGLRARRYLILLQSFK